MVVNASRAAYSHMNRKSKTVSYKAEREALMFQDGECQRCAMKSLFLRQCSAKVQEMEEELTRKDGQIIKLKSKIKSHNAQILEVYSDIDEQLRKMAEFAIRTANQFLPLAPNKNTGQVIKPTVDFESLEGSAGFLEQMNLTWPCKPEIDQPITANAIRYGLARAFVCINQMKLQCEALNMELLAAQSGSVRSQRIHAGKSHAAEPTSSFEQSVSELHSALTSQESAYEGAQRMLVESLQWKEHECRELKMRISLHESGQMHVEVPQQDEPNDTTVHKPCDMHDDLSIRGTPIGLKQMIAHLKDAVDSSRASCDQLRQQLASTYRELEIAVSERAKALSDGARAHAECVQLRRVLEAHSLDVKPQRAELQSPSPGATEHCPSALASAAVGFTAEQPVLSIYMPENSPHSGHVSKPPGHVPHSIRSSQRPESSPHSIQTHTDHSAEPILTLPRVQISQPLDDVDQHAVRSDNGSSKTRRPQSATVVRPAATQYVQAYANLSKVQMGSQHTVPPQANQGLAGSMLTPSKSLQVMTPPVGERGFERRHAHIRTQVILASDRNKTATTHLLDW